MESNQNLQIRTKKHIKKSVENYLSGIGSPEFGEIALYASKLLQENSIWEEITYEKHGDVKKRVRNVNLKGENIAQKLYSECIIPCVLQRVESINSMQGKIESVWLYGSLNKNPEKVSYASDIDLIACPRTDISEKDFKNLRTMVLGKIKNIADMFGKYPSEIIQVSQREYAPSYVMEGQRLL